MGFFTSEQIDPVTSPSFDSYTTDAYKKFLGDYFYNTTNANGEAVRGIYPVKSFNPNDAQAQAAQSLVVNPNANLTKTWNAWQPWDGGTSYLANYITNGAGPSQGVSQAQNNLMQYGGVGGYPTDLMHQQAQQGGVGYGADLMHNMAQFGGTGGPGNNAMSLAMQYGAPSAAGQFASNMAQYGIASTGSGQPLANRAYGQSSPAMALLAPFMQNAGKQFVAPQIQFQPFQRKA